MKTRGLPWLLAAGALLVLVWGGSPERIAAGRDQVTIAVDQVLASGFTHPVQITNAGDGSGRLFVVEQPGTIRVIKNGAVLPTPFLDLTALTNDSGEQGLLGLAFHPDFASNGWFYVDYTRPSDGATRIMRYTATLPGSDVADPNSAAEVLTISQPYTNHNGGQVMFGPDGYLYIGMGDGGSGGDPQGNGQNPDTLLGALLRLDVTGGLPYAIPPDNPFVGSAGRDEVWATGLRNPWRFSFDRTTGDLYIGDVGQNLWEEIDRLPAGTPGGTNFGWNCMEGFHTYDFTAACATRTLTGPIAEYGHDVGDAVTGGFVYRGTLYPNLVGRYFYADYGTGRIWSLVATNTGVVGPELELETGLAISAFGEGEDGELYVVDRAGTIRVLVDALPIRIWLPVIARNG